MGDLKARLNNARTKLLRRGSQTSTSARSTASVASTTALSSSGGQRSSSLTKLPRMPSHHGDDHPGDREASEKAFKQLSKSVELPKAKRGDLHASGTGAVAFAASPAGTTPTSRDRPSPSSEQHRPSTEPASPASARPPSITVEEPTPSPHIAVLEQPLTHKGVRFESEDAQSAVDFDKPSPLPLSRLNTKSPSPGVFRKQSLVTASNARIIKTLLGTEGGASTEAGSSDSYPAVTTDLDASMLHRKIWVRRPNASATLVQIKESDLVDDVRDMILKKYANSLGRSFDSPDVSLRLYPRDPSPTNPDRLLGPEEDMCRTLDAYYPDGQTINDALLIEVPQRRTPRPSPRANGPYYYAVDDNRPLDNAQEYFPPMPLVHPSPAALTSNSHESRASLPHAPHSIAVLQTGQLPPLPLPSPGSTHRGRRPKYPRQHTASPTTLTGAAPTSATSVRPGRQDSSASDSKHSIPGHPLIPTPPAPEGILAGRQSATPPIPRVASPRPGKARKKQRNGADAPVLPAGLLDGSVPPINVLIVEDNIINLRVLGAFMQRLKVRWQRALNGKEAVDKWRAGGFHLVLMDIQLPVMNGLEATKEIRRLERVNNIGVFSSGSNEAPHHKLGDASKQEREVKEEDKLGDSSLFKSPVIIVALTASSLQSDRHEALAAGCNDFLTKPVNFVWLERKVKEWGCMQALIDYDGWRKWKDFHADSDTADSAAKLSASFSSTAPRTRIKTSSSPTTVTSPTGGLNGSISKPKELRERRKSIGPPTVIEEKESNTPTPELESSSRLVSA